MNHITRDYRRKSIAHAVDRTELARRTQADARTAVALADLRAATAAVVAAKAALADIWDEHAFAILEARP